MNLAFDKISFSLFVYAVRNDKLMYIISSKTMAKSQRETHIDPVIGFAWFDKNKSKPFQTMQDYKAFEIYIRF